MNLRARDSDTKHRAALGIWRGIAPPDEGRFDSGPSPPGLADDDDAIELLTFDRFTVELVSRVQFVKAKVVALTALALHSPAAAALRRLAARLP